MGGRATVITKTVSSIGELLASFDVDCAAVCFDVGTGCTSMTARAKRAFEHNCNVVDMRFDHTTYLLNSIIIVLATY